MTLLFAIAGGALLVTMITAVFIDFLTLSPSEAIVVSTLKQRETDRGLRQYATLLIQVRPLPREGACGEAAVPL